MKKRSKKPEIVFITGTDTGVGKTVMTVLLLRHLRSSGMRAVALKPFCSGARDDARWLWKECAGDLTLQEINPFHFSRPIAPGAALLGRKERIDLGALCSRIEAVASRFECTLVEGIGGLLVPLGGGMVLADLIERLGCRVILVSRDGLGTLNHTLLTISEMQRRRLKLSAIVLMRIFRGDVSQRTNLRVLSQQAPHQSFVRLPKIGKGSELRPAGERDRRFLKITVAKISALSIVCTRRWQPQQAKAAEGKNRQAQRAG